MLPVKAVLALAALLAVVPAAAAHPAAGTELVLVAAEDDDRLVALLPETGRVVARLRVPDGPHNVAVARDLRTVAVTSPPAGRLTLVDAFRPRVVAVLAGFAYPHDVEFSPDGRWAYVTEEHAGRVAVVSVARRRVVARIAVGGPPHDLAVRGDGKRVWVTRGRALGIAILDPASPSHPRVVGNGGARGAHDIAFGADGLRVWVTYWDGGLVGQLHAYARTGSLRSQQLVGRLVHHVQVDARGRLWATDHHLGLLYRLSRAGARAWAVGGCPGAHHVGVGAGRGRVAVACHDSGTVLVYDPVTRRTRSYAVGRGPHGAVVAFVP